MYFIKLFRYLRGYVRFLAKSGSIERFINLCAHHRIPTWDCRKTNEGFTGCTPVSGYRRMHRLARKAGVRTRVTERHGAPFIVHRYRKRIGIAAGVLLFALFLIVTQQFIWRIEIDGCKRIDPQVISNALEELGVRRGSLKGKIDARDVQQKLMFKVEDISWAALNMRGTTATLQIRERVLAPDKIDTRVPANVVAAQDGQIQRMEVTDGKALLKKGDTVCAGDIIVTGVIEDRWGMTHLLRANARVIANVPQTLEIKIPLQQESVRMTGKVVKRRYLELGSLRVPLFLYRGLEGNYKVEQVRRAPQVGNVQLPFEITRESYIFYEEEEQAITQETALGIAKRQLTATERKLWGDAVVSREISASTEGGVLTLRGEYVVERDIAKQVEIPVVDRARQAKEKPLRPGGY